MSQRRANPSNKVGRLRIITGGTSVGAAGLVTVPRSFHVRNWHKSQGAPESRRNLLQVWWKRWSERQRFAQELACMPDEALADFSMTRQEARRACRRPFWLP